MADKIKINWVSDSSGLTSCHLNNGGKPKDTYVGHIFMRDNQWWSKHKDGSEHGPHKNYFAAKLDVERSVNGEPV